MTASARPRAQIELSEGPVHHCSLCTISHAVSRLLIFPSRLFTQDRGSYTWLDSLAITYYCDQAEGGSDDYPTVLLKECADKPSDILSPFQMYVGAIYWSITTITSVGYGDISARNLDEMLVCTVCILISSCVWAYIIGNVCGIMATLDVDGIEHHQAMDALNHFIHERGFDDKLGLVDGALESGAPRS